MNSFTLTIPGEPMGKQRARTVKPKNSSFVRSYTPEKTVNYETLVKELFVMNHCPRLEGEICIQVLAYFSIPKSTSNKKASLMEDGCIRPTKKPDCDNILKIICDALNGCAYHDDAQITEAHVRKYFTRDNPRVVIEINETHLQ